MNRVKDKVAIVTGSASGIGKATAQLLSQEGAKVIVADRNISGGEQTTEEIRKEGGTGRFFNLDVSKEENWSELFKTAMSEFGKVDILVNCAGTIFSREIKDTSLEEWNAFLSINLNGVFLGTKHAIRTMKESGGGAIVNISSVVGIVASADDTSAYGANKAAIRLFTKAAAIECSKAVHNYNIRVNSVHPGLIETPMSASLLNGVVSQETLESKTPIGFFGGPKDIAYGVLYLASDEARFVTGTELVIDGGWTSL